MRLTPLKVRWRQQDFPEVVENPDVTTQDGTNVWGSTNHTPRGP
jgi:hypothetical protein